VQKPTRLAVLNISLNFECLFVISSVSGKVLLLQCGYDHGDSLFHVAQIRYPVSEMRNQIWNSHRESDNLSMWRAGVMLRTCMY
jgi:hypothetical protein